MEATFLGLDMDVFLNISSIACGMSAAACVPVALWFRHTKRWHALGLLVFITGLGILAIAFQVQETGLRRFLQSMALLGISGGTIFMLAVAAKIMKKRRLRDVS